MHIIVLSIYQTYTLDCDEAAEPKQFCPCLQLAAIIRLPYTTHWHLEKAPKDLNQIRLYGHGVLQMLHNPQLRADFP